MGAPLRGEPTPGVHTLLAGVPDAVTQFLPAGLLQLLRIQTVPELLLQSLTGPHCWKRVRPETRGSIGVIKDEPRRTRLRELNRTFDERPVMLALACISKDAVLHVASFRPGGPGLSGPPNSDLRDFVLEVFCLVLHRAHSTLSLALVLLLGSLGFHFLVVGHITDFATSSARHLVHFALDLVFTHGGSPSSL